MLDNFIILEEIAKFNTSIIW